MDCSMPGFPVLHYRPEFAQLMSTDLVMPSNHLILCCLLLHLPSIFPSIRVFSNELALHIRWPMYWSFSISPSNEYSELISFKIGNASVWAHWNHSFQRHLTYLEPVTYFHILSFLSSGLTVGIGYNLTAVQFSSVMSDSATPWTTAHQASLSITNAWSLLKLMSTESVMPSNHLILCRPLLLPTLIFPSIRVFSNESVLHIKWPKD